MFAHWFKAHFSGWDLQSQHKNGIQGLIYFLMKTQAIWTIFLLKQRPCIIEFSLKVVHYEFSSDAVSLVISYISEAKAEQTDIVFKDDN